MMSSKPIPSAKEISSSIKKKRADARRLLIRRIVKTLIVSTIIALVGGIMFAIDQSDLLRIENILVSNAFLSDEREIRNHLPFQRGDRLWLNLPQWTSLTIHDDAIESLSFKMNGRNVIVWVHEYKPLALTQTHILLSNGTFYPLTPRLTSQLSFLPHVIGFEESELSVKLANALLSVEDFVLNLMANIVQNPSSFDDAMMVITLNNGLHIHSDMRSLFLLNQLPLFIDLINENNNCLYLDSVTSTARAAPCP